MNTENYGLPILNDSDAQTEKVHDWRNKITGVQDDSAMMKIDRVLAEKADLDVYDPQGKASDVFKYADDAVQTLKDNPLLTGGIPIATTYTPDGGIEGKNYAIDVPGITEIYEGLTLKIKFHMDNIDTSPRLSINNLPEVLIARRRSDSGFVVVPPIGMFYRDAALSISCIQLPAGTFRWLINEAPKPVATDLLGTCGVANGGTGITSVTVGSYLVGNGTDALQPKMAAEVLTDIGAVPVERKINGKSLSADVTLTAGDVGALGVESGNELKATLYAPEGLVFSQMGTRGGVRLSGYSEDTAEGPNPNMGVLSLADNENDMGAIRVKGIVTPTDPTDAANKEYVDQQVAAAARESKIITAEIRFLNSMSITMFSASILLVDDGYSLRVAGDQSYYFNAPMTLQQIIITIPNKYGVKFGDTGSDSRYCLTFSEIVSGRINLRLANIDAYGKTSYTKTLYTGALENAGMVTMCSGVLATSEKVT